MQLIYLGIGLVSGVLSGMFGIGGGILITPALLVLAKFPTRLALGTSLGALLLPVGLLGAYTYWEQGHLNVRASLLISAGSSVCGAGHAWPTCFRSPHCSASSPCSSSASRFSCGSMPVSGDLP